MRDSYIQLSGLIILSVAILLGSFKVGGALERISDGTEVSGSVTIHSGISPIELEVRNK